MSKFNAIKSEIDSAILLYAIVVVLVLLLLALHVFVATALWRWHVVPLGVKELSPWHTLGIMCVMGAFRWVALPRSRSDEEDGWQWFKRAFANPLFLLVIGYVAKEMM